MAPPLTLAEFFSNEESYKTSVEPSSMKIAPPSVA